MQHIKCHINLQLSCSHRNEYSIWNGTTINHRTTNDETINGSLLEPATNHDAAMTEGRVTSASESSYRRMRHRFTSPGYDNKGRVSIDMRSYCDRSTLTTTNKPIEIKIETCSISECCQIHGKISSENCTDSHANTKRTT